MSEGFKKRNVKPQLSEAEMKEKTENFANKADTDPEKTNTHYKTTQRNIRFTVRMNESELKELEKICEATGCNKVVAVRQALKAYAKNLAIQ